jgi:hypothetical protein
MDDFLRSLGIGPAKKGSASTPDVGTPYADSPADQEKAGSDDPAAVPEPAAAAPSGERRSSLDGPREKPRQGATAVGKTAPRIQLDVIAPLAFPALLAAKAASRRKDDGRANVRWREDFVLDAAAPARHDPNRAFSIRPTRPEADMSVP